MSIQFDGTANSSFTHDARLNFMKTAGRETVYELSVDDLQQVAREVLERELTSAEVVAVGNAVGDYIDWFQATENAIYRCVRDSELPS